MKHPVGYVEVTVAAAMLQPDGSILHDVMADATIAFGLPTPPPLRELTEAEVTQTINANLPRVMAAIETVLLMNGAVHMGQP